MPSYQRNFYFSPELLNSNIITISNITYNYLITNYNIPASKISNIYQGIDTSIYQLSDVPVFQLEYPHLHKHSPILGCIGYLEERKGQKILLQSLAILLSQSLPNVYLIIVGNGPDEILIKQTAKRLGLVNNILFVPFTRNVVSILQTINILITPSLFKEGIPNVILEAFAMNIPVIASNIGGIPEVVVNGETGYLVDPGKADQLANVIVKLWENPNSIISMGSKARDLVLKDHDRLRQLQKYEDYIKKFVEELREI